MRVSLPPTIIALVGVVSLSGEVTAAPRSAPAARAGTAPDLARLEAEIKDQRDLLIQSMQIEQQHYDLLLRLIQSLNQGNVASVAAPSAAGSAPARAGAADAPSADPNGARALLIPSMGAAAAPMPDPPPRKAPDRTGSVSGKVSVSSGKLDDVYVYVQNVHGPATRSRTLEIAQRDKQFVPSVAVVQRGTRVTFPNFDAIYHNVFSSGPPHAFDLGSYRAGDTPRAVEMSTPGVVELYCNMHAKMHASVLVVPNALWTRVSSDGSFQINNVPIGVRKVVAWSPRSRAVEQTVDLGPSGASVNIQLNVDGGDRPHNNKYGMPYGSYNKE